MIRRKPMLMALILCITMIITMMPAAAFAEDTVNYRLWIGGVRVTSAHMSEINEAGEGWIYEGDGKQGTLTLRNATITGRHKPGFGNFQCMIYSDDIDLTIKLEGTNNVLKNDSADYIDGIHVAGGPLTITGDAKLSITASQYGIVCNNGLTLDNVDITANTGDDCILLSSGSYDYTINGGKLILTSKNIDHLTYSRGNSGISCYDLTINKTDLTIDAEDYGITGYDLMINDCKNVNIHSNGFPALYAANEHNIVINNSEGINITANKDDAVVTNRGAIRIIDSNVTAHSGVKSSDGFHALKASNGNVEVSSNGGDIQTYVKATINKSTSPAVYAGNSIILGDDIEIVTPENGKIGKYIRSESTGNAVVNSDGLTPAPHVILKGVAKHTVSYEYTGTAPEGAPDLPESKVYRVGADVAVAEAPTLEGYTFSGWSKTGTFEMPDEDVVITGSWTEIPEPEPTPAPTPTPQPEPAPAPAPTPQPEPTPVQPEVTPAPAAAPVVSDDILLAKMTSKGNTGLAVSWNLIPGAEGYDVFLARCNSGENRNAAYKEYNADGSTRSMTLAGLNARTAYKAIVKAWVTVNGAKTYVKESPVIHAYTSGGNKKYTNPKSLKVKKTKVTVKKGKTYKIKAKVRKLKKSKKLMTAAHAPKVRYISSNRSVATVSSKGRIKGISKGSCYVYAYAQNGVSKRITVRVK